MKPLILKFMAATGFFVGSGAVTPIPDAVVPARHAPVREINLEARALARTSGDAQAKMRRLLAEFGEPEVRVFTVTPDGTMKMTVKKI